MDKLDTLTLFVRIVERGSFSAAAADLGVSRPVATAAIKALEVSLAGAAATSYDPARTADGRRLAVLSALRVHSGGP